MKRKRSFQIAGQAVLLLTLTNPPAQAQPAQSAGPAQTTSQSATKQAGQLAQANLSLTLAQATEMALKNNLASTLSRERVAEAKGQKALSLAELLPCLQASSFAGNQTANLAAMGFTAGVFPGIRPFLGPYSVFDARLRMTQTIFNLGSIWRFQAGRAGEAIATQQERFVAQQVATATALAYLRAAAAAETVASANANLQWAERLLELATHQRNAGLATGLDVARAETHVADRQVQLAAAQTEQDTARLELLRLTGAPLASELTLAEPMRFEPVEAADARAAVLMAWVERSDLLAAEQQVRATLAERKAATAGYAPTLSFEGDYGVSGIKPNDLDLPTRSVAVSLNLPVFDGGRTRAAVRIAASVERQAKAQFADLKAAIEKDVRLAIDNLTTREAQMRAAQKTLALATRELELAQDRFQNGVGDNIEVLNAQTALESARQTLVVSLAQFHVARLNLASATGRVQDFRL